MTEAVFMSHNEEDEDRAHVEQCGGYRYENREIEQAELVCKDDNEVDREGLERFNKIEEKIAEGADEIEELDMRNMQEYDKPSRDRQPSEPVIMLTRDR